MKIGVTKTSTNAGKTIAAAIVVEAREANYCNPVQVADVAHSNSHKSNALIHNNSCSLVRK